MSVISKINSDAKAVARGNRVGKAKGRSNKAGFYVETDLGFDLGKLVEDLDATVLKNTVDQVNTVVRKEAVRMLKGASSDSRIGRSKYGKMTRGDWRNPRVTNAVYTPGRRGVAGGTNYLPGGWYGKVLDRRGKDKPSMVKNGGRNGKTGIISKSPRLKNGKRGYYGITGPVYGKDDKDNSKFGHNHAHIHEGVNGPAKHYNWGRPGGTLKVRPWLGPAGEKTQGIQRSIVIRNLKEWVR